MANMEVKMYLKDLKEYWAIHKKTIFFLFNIPLKFYFQPLGGDLPNGNW